MSISVLLSPAPGWYPDPAGIADYRWWDGETWTEGTHASVEPVVETAPPARQPAAALVSEFESTLKPTMQLFADPEPAPVAPVVSLEVPLTDLAPVGVSAPGSTAPTVAAAPRTAARGGAPAKTRWSSMLLAFPFVFPIVVGMIVALGYAGGAASSTSALIVIAVIAGIGGLIPAWVFADHDRRELIARGYEPAPSIAWMLLLPPVAYLLARRRAVGPSY